jgi:hypothetical protein
MLTGNTITVKVTNIKTNATWTATGVYGPQGDLKKKLFLRELKHVKRTIQTRWLLLGDFNLIYRAQDKNNGHLNQRLMLRFKRVLNYLEVKELELVGRHFTWSNSQSTPTMTHIDRVFCTPAWEDLYPNPILQPLLSSTSYHCPILVVPLITPYIKPKFHFESYWAQMPSFRESVQEAWSKVTPPNQNPLVVLHIKLSKMVIAQEKWSRTLISQGKMALTVCREVIKQLEKA